MALSHCWGTQARFVLDSDSLIQLLGGVDMNGLSPTFRNAIKGDESLRIPLLVDRFFMYPSRRLRRLGQ